MVVDGMGILRLTQRWPPMRRRRKWLPEALPSAVYGQMMIAAPTPASNRSAADGTGGGVNGGGGGVGAAVDVTPAVVVGASVPDPLLSEPLPSLGGEGSALKRRRGPRELRCCSTDGGNSGTLPITHGSCSVVSNTVKDVAFGFGMMT